MPARTKQTSRNKVKHTPQEGECSAKGQKLSKLKTLKRNYFHCKSGKSYRLTSDVITKSVVRVGGSKTISTGYSVLFGRANTI